MVNALHCKFYDYILMYSNAYLMVREISSTNLNPLYLCAGWYSILILIHVGISFFKLSSDYIAVNNGVCCQYATLAKIVCQRILMHLNGFSIMDQICCTFCHVYNYPCERLRTSLCVPR